MATPLLPVPSSQSSSHVTTVFSQGPPSHNTHSSVMNRVVPNAVPLTTYLSALTQGHTSETVTSPQFRPSMPRPHHSDVNLSTQGSMICHPSPPHTTNSSSHHLTPPDLHPFTRPHKVVNPMPSSHNEKCANGVCRNVRTSKNH